MMIICKTYGSPYPTDAISCWDGIRSETGAPGTFDRFTIRQEENPDPGFLLSCTLQKTDQVFGLGENVRGINKRGWIYESACLDHQTHLETTSALYSAHNFLLIGTRKPVGIFIDHPGRVLFDIGYTEYDKLNIKIEGKNFNLLFITGDSCPEIVKQFRHAIGTSYLPPLWAFGFQQSRWGYDSEENIRHILSEYEAADMPIDMIGLDIDYMDNYKDFTVNGDNFPDFKQFIRSLKETGIRLIPIIDAGVKCEEDYPVYEEGRKNDYFCKRKDGTDFIVGVWPGRSCLPDFLNPDTREWFGDQYRFLVEQGIDGFWNDMNEPAIFYSEESLQEAWDKIDRYRGKDLDVLTYFEIINVFGTLINNPADYKRFYHNTPVGKMRGDRVHNLYGYMMTRCAAEGLKRNYPDKRFLLFSRSSAIGMHRYAGIWTGDNKAWWGHLAMNVKMMPSLNMCGFLYVGADLGGFLENTTEDLLLRWLAFAVFTPLLRNHAHKSTRKKEFFRFPQKDMFRSLLRFRYALIPWLYSEYMKAALSDELLFYPLAFLYPEDAYARAAEDQLFVGRSLMIAPVIEQNAIGRSVYLPEDMLLLKFRSEKDYTFEKMEKGHHFIDVDLGEIPVLLRKNSLLPLCAPAKNTSAMDTSSFTVLGYVESEAEYLLYEDDGVCTDAAMDSCFTKKIRIFRQGENFHIMEDAGKNLQIMIQ